MEEHPEETVAIKKSLRRLRICFWIILVLSLHFPTLFFVVIGIYVYIKKKKREKHALLNRYLENHNLALPKRKSFNFEVTPKSWTLN